MRPDGGKRLSEELHAVVFIFVAHFAPTGMITALLTAACVATGRLEVSIGPGTNPYIGPCRRNRQRLDACDLVLIADRFAFRVEILKAFAPAVMPGLVSLTQRRPANREDSTGSRITSAVEDMALEIRRA